MRPTLGFAGLFVAALLVPALPLAASAQQQWSTVKGQITLNGAVPAAKPIAAPAGAICPAMLNDNALEVDPKTKGIRYAVVSLIPAAPGGNLPLHPDLAAVPKNAVEIDQPKCLFEPRVVALRQGQSLVVKNSSKIAHNVSYSGKDSAGNPLTGNPIIQPAGEHAIANLGVSKYPMNIACSIHPWMGGKVAVFDHPYFALTDKDGKFEIKDAPVGDFRLLVWHEEFGWLGGKEGAKGHPVTVPAKKDAEVNLKY